MICLAGWCLLTYLDNLGSTLASTFGLLTYESICTSMPGSLASLSCTLISESECASTSFCNSTPDYNSVPKCNLTFIVCDSTFIVYDSIVTKTFYWFSTWFTTSSSVGISS